MHVVGRRRVHPAPRLAEARGRRRSDGPAVGARGARAGRTPEGGRGGRRGRPAVSHPRAPPAVGAGVDVRVRVRDPDQRSRAEPGVSRTRLVSGEEPTRRHVEADVVAGRNKGVLVGRAAGGPVGARDVREAREVGAHTVAGRETLPPKSDTCSRLVGRLSDVATEVANALEPRP